MDPVIEEVDLGKTAIIIPCKNEDKSIQGLLDLVEENIPDAEIILVDDNSDRQAAGWLQNSKQIHYLRSPITLGIGGAVQLGIKYAFKNGFETFVRIDGDGQHPPKYIPELIEKTKANTLVRGVRSHKDFMKSSTIFRRIGSYYFMALFKIVFKKTFSDPTSGFHSFSRDIAEKFTHYYPMDYPEIESSVLLLKSGANIRDVTVKMNSRKAGRSSIDLFHTVVYVFSVTVAFIISIYRKNPYRKTENDNSY